MKPSTLSNTTASIIFVVPILGMKTPWTEGSMMLEGMHKEASLTEDYFCNMCIFSLVVYM